MELWLECVLFKRPSGHVAAHEKADLKLFKEKSIQFYVSEPILSILHKRSLPLLLAQLWLA